MFKRLERLCDWEGCPAPTLPKLGGARTGVGFLGIVHTPHMPLYMYTLLQVPV